MAFKIYQTDDGRVPGIEYLPAGAITPKVGMVLTQTSGKLAIATGTTAPTYVSMCERETACTDGEIIPVLRILPDMIFETEFSADAAGVNLGDKVTLNAANGLDVTATTTSGVAEVVYMDGTASGSMCRVRFAQSAVAAAMAAMASTGGGQAAPETENSGEQAAP